MEDKLEPNQSQKFVVVETLGGDYLLRGDVNAKWHKDIVDKMMANGSSISRVIGGGRIMVDTTSEKIYVWDTSHNYGGVPFNVCKKLLEKMYDYTVLDAVPEKL